LLVQLFHERLLHRNKFDHNLFHKDATPNQQPQPLYTPLLTYYFEMN
jgi:hypothetical protein